MTNLELKYTTVATRDLPRIASALERIAAVVERASADDEDGRRTKDGQRGKPERRRA